MSLMLSVQKECIVGFSENADTLQTSEKLKDFIDVNLENTQLLLKTSFSLRITKGDVLFLRKEYLKAYETENTSVRLKKMSLNGVIMEIVELHALRNTEIYLDANSVIEVTKGELLHIPFVIGWLNNLPSFKNIPCDYKEYLCLVWDDTTNVIIQT